MLAGRVGHIHCTELLYSHLSQRHSSYFEAICCFLVYLKIICPRCGKSCIILMTPSYPSSLEPPCGRHLLLKQARRYMCSC